MTPGSKAGGPNETSSIEQPRLLSLFGSGVAGLSFAWLPLAAVVQIDALRRSMSWSELIGLLARAQGLLALFAAVLALIAWTCARRLKPRRAAAAAWLVVLLPVASLCTGQLIYILTLWVSGLAGSRSWVAGPVARWVPLALFVLWVSVRLFRDGSTRIARMLSDHMRPLRLPALVLTAVCAALAWPEVWERRTARGVQPPGNAPHVLLISIDTLAYEDADLCGRGSEPAVMPNLRALALRSVCFTRAYANANATTPATSSITSGVLPWRHHAYQTLDAIEPGLRGQVLSERFRANGWHAVAVTDTMGASPYQHGTWSSFDQTELLPGGATTALDHLTSSAVRSSAVVALWPLIRLLVNPIEVLVSGGHPLFQPEHLVNRFRARWLQAHESGRPVFAWLHSWTPHSPYLPPGSTRYRLLPPGELEHLRDLRPGQSHQYMPSEQPLIDKHRLRYRESMMALDLELGKLIDALSVSGDLDRMVVVVVADHGESFENGFMGHANQNLDEAVIRIPMLIKLPGQQQGRIANDLVSQVDLAPTLLALAGIPSAAGVPQDGRSLLPLLKGEPCSEAPVYTMGMPSASRFHPIQQGRFAVIDGPWKYVLELPSGKSSLHDLTIEPAGTTNLASRAPEVARRLDTLLRRQLMDAEARRRVQFEH